MSLGIGPHDSDCQCERCKSRRETPEDFAAGNAGVAVHGRKGGVNVIYVILDDRAVFDLIDLPLTDHGPKPHGHVITKAIDGPQYVIFQYWLEKP